MKPRVLILIGAFWPGHDSAGPNLSVKAMCQTLGGEFDFLLIARDRPFGAPAAIVDSEGWHDLGWAKIHYLTVGGRGAEGLTALMRDTPHDLLLINGFFDREFTIPAMLARRFGRAPRAPLVISPRGEFSSGALGLKGVRKSVYLAMARALNLVDRATFHVTSETEADDVRAEFPGNNVVTIANLRPLFALPRYEPAHVFRAAFLGRISPVKGLDVALEALARVVGRVDFTIYGPISDPAYWRRCEALIAALPPNVTARYGGELANDDVPFAMVEQEVLLLPSRSENFGHAIFESLAAGTPVIIGDKTPWRGLAAATAGFDLPLGEPAEFARAVDTLAGLPSEQYLAWRAGARKVAEDFLATSTAAQDMAALFHDLARTTSKPAGAKR